MNTKTTPADGTLASSPKWILGGLKVWTAAAKKSPRDKTVKWNLKWFRTWAKQLLESQRPMTKEENEALTAFTMTELKSK